MVFLLVVLVSILIVRLLLIGYDVVFVLDFLVL